MTCVVVCLRINSRSFVPNAHILFCRNYFLSKDNPEAIWLAHTLRHMAKTLPWIPHSLSLQNLQMILELTKVTPDDARILPTEFVETLRAGIKRAGLDAIDMDDISDRLSRAGIQLSAEDRALIGY